MAYLMAKGYHILERNYHTPFGELDIIASYHPPREARRLVFVEVKTRRTRRFGFPEEGITAKKLRHLIQSSQDYLQKNSLEDIDWQIDVLSIEMDERQQAVVTHLENITTSLNVNEIVKSDEHPR